MEGGRVGGGGESFSGAGSEHRESDSGGEKATEKPTEAMKERRPKQG